VIFIINILSVAFPTALWFGIGFIVGLFFTKLRKPEDTSGSGLGFSLRELNALYNSFIQGCIYGIICLVSIYFECSSEHKWSYCFWSNLLMGIINMIATKPE